jgi:hypothetical protein
MTVRGNVERQNLLSQRIIEILKNNGSPNMGKSLSCFEITKKLRIQNRQNTTALSSFEDITRKVYHALVELQQAGMLHQVNERWRLTKRGSKVKTDDKNEFYQSGITHQVNEHRRLTKGGSKGKTDENKNLVLFSLLTQRKTPETKNSTDNLVYQSWVFAQMGDGKIVWGTLQNESELEAIVTSWRARQLTSTDQHLLPHITELPKFFNFVGAGVSSNIFPLFSVKRLVGKELWTRATKTRWEKCGLIIKCQKYPFAIREKKPVEQRSKLAKINQINRHPFISVTYLNWEVLPPGWWNNPKFFTNSKGKLSHALKPDDIERIKFIDNLLPEKQFVGKNCLGHRLYWVAVFPACVIAESAKYGNAAYIVRDKMNWRSILSRPKRQVIQLGPKVAYRIPHAHNFRSRIIAIVRKD